jgi:hypothetical protein
MASSPALALAPAPAPAPPGPLPAPLLLADGGFTADTLLRRLPAILRETCLAAAAPRALAQAVEASLCAPLAAGQLLPPPRTDAEGLWAPASPAAPNCAPASFWYQENVAYRHLLALWEEHGLGGQDPFGAQKAQALEAARGAFLAGLQGGDGGTAAQLLHAALLRSLWGNRADLSLSAGKVVAVEAGGGGAAAAPGAAPAAAAAEALLLADDAPAALALLLQAPAAAAPREVAIVLDNCGLELLQDLRLADALLASGAAGAVTLHAKRWPTFVSDALPADVEAHVAWLGGCDCPRARALQARLQRALAAGALRLASHAFWNCARPGWGLPGELRSALGACALAVFKGDANYRRLLGDLHWPHATPFEAVVGAYAPCPVLALRTCKCGLAVGVSEAQEARARAASPSDWLTSGRFGLIQLARPLRQAVAPA